MESLINSYNKSQMEWNHKILDINEKVLNEILNYDDIILIDLIDIYRNLPQKILLFFQQ